MMKIALFAAALLSAALVRAEATEVGFAELRITNGDRKPLVVGVWYPTSAPAEVHPLGAYVQTVAPDAPVGGEHLPLVVMSHAHGGQGRGVYVMDQPQHMHRLIDYMLSEWPDHARLDAGRIGVFGFSIGGF